MQVSKSCTKIANNVNIPGFRKGKAPRAIIEMHYGKEAVKQEAFNWLLTKHTAMLWNKKN